MFMEEPVPLLERHVPLKMARKQSQKRMNRMRRLLFRRLGKIKTKIRSATSVPKLTKLLQTKQELEKQLFEDYFASNVQEEDKAVFNLKSNPKSFFSFAKSRQILRPKLGLF